MDTHLEINKETISNSHPSIGHDHFQVDRPNASNCSSCFSSSTTPSPHSTANSTISELRHEAAQSSSAYAVWQVVLIAVVCCVIVAGTVLGNVLVCTAVSIVRKLRTPSNLLIVSLAVSDLLVALLDMPFATAYEVMGQWVFGQTVCDIWTSLDVLLCTASILNLCMISVDRYFVITRPFQYAMKRTPVRMLLMIAAAWSLSAIISIPPLFGWRADHKDGICSVSQAISYQFYATIGAFYLPLTVMIIIYTRIYMVSYRIAQAEASSRPTPVLDRRPSPCPLSPPPVNCHPPPAAAAAAAPSNASGSVDGAGGKSPAAAAQVTRTPKTAPSDEEENHNMHNGKQVKHNFLVVDEILARSRVNPPSSGDKLVPKSRGGGGGGGGGGGHRLSCSNERKATKTLGVIMGAFTACWLPFFILALIKPFCRRPESCIPHWLSSLFLWLGYANSFLNPIIYARFNRDFRTPFRHILQCRCRDINSRLRSENFAEQFGPTETRETAASRPPAGAAQTTAETFVRFSCQGRAVVKLK